MVIKEELLTVNKPSKNNNRRPTVCSVESDETISRKKIFGERVPTSSYKVSSPSGRYKQSNGKGSENKRYDTSYSSDESLSESSKEDGKELLSNYRQT